MNKILRSTLLRTFTLHTAQAIGAALTASSVDLPALTEGTLTIDSYSSLTAGVLVQTAIAGFDWLRKRKKARALEAATKS